MRPEGTALSSRASEACGTNPVDFTTAEVLNWLENEVDLPQFDGEFLAHNVDGATIEEIAKADLAWLGVKNPIQQAQIIGKWKKAKRAHELCAELQRTG
jgi:hypothetical protein